MYIADGSTLQISGNCFDSNRFAGAAPVVVKGGAGLFNSSKNFGTVDSGVDCQFASVGGNDSSCIKFESATCSADPTLSDNLTASSGNAAMAFSWGMMATVFAVFCLTP